jgi:hypothetical protein
MATSASDSRETRPHDEEIDIDAEDSFLERTPITLLIALTGLFFVGVGYLLDYLGYDLWAGVTGAFAVVILAIAILGQLFVWGSAHL